MKIKIKGLFIIALIILLCNIQISSYALCDKLIKIDNSSKGSENIKSMTDSKMKYYGKYYFKVDTLNVSIYDFKKDDINPINELSVTDEALKNATYRDMFFIENKLILIYEILNKELMPYENNFDSIPSKKIKSTFINSSKPDETPKKTFDSRGNLIFFYDISDIKNIELEKKLYIHGDYETTVQRNDNLYILTSVPSKGSSDLLDKNTTDLTDIINIDNGTSDRIHNLTKVDLVNQSFRKISSIKCDSIIEYLSEDSLYFVNLDNSNSTIYKLSMDSDVIKYINKFSVDGYLTNPKFINDYNNKLYFIYQSSENYRNYNLVLLDENFHLIKEIKNINNSRQITSVQFQKSSVKLLLDYDHTKIIDLSNPTNPKIS